MQQHAKTLGLLNIILIDAVDLESLELLQGGGMLLQQVFCKVLQLLWGQRPSNDRWEVRQEVPWGV
jgi:hypothetical protein